MEPPRCADLAAEYLSKKVRPELRSAKAVERRLKKNCLPVIGDVTLADLHKRDMNRVIAPIMARGKQVEAARVFEDVRAMIRWATAEGHLDFNPFEGMRKPAARPPRTRVLTDAELAKLWNGLDKALPRSRTVQDIIRLCLLTARVSERLPESSPTRSTLRSALGLVPANVEEREPNTVPLTDAAFEIAKVIAAGPKLSGHAVAHTIRLAQDRFGLDHWTAHDLRRTAVNSMANWASAHRARQRHQPYQRDQGRRHAWRLSAI